MAVDLIFSPVFIGLITLLMTLAVANWIQKTKRMNKVSEHIPGPPGYPFIGLSHRIVGKDHNRKFHVVDFPQIATAKSSFCTQKFSILPSRNKRNMEKL